MTTRVKVGIAIVALLVLVIAGLSLIQYTVDQRSSDGTTTESSGESAPELVGITGWINSEPLTLADLRRQGKVVLVDFWTFSCINCIRTFPFVNDWYRKYSDEGLVIIGVHAPEFEFEKDAANVQTAMRKWGIGYPVALDNDFATWRAYNNRYWPAKYLVDRRGNIRYYHFGEGKYDETEDWIRHLLAEDGQGTSEPMGGVAETPSSAATPEIYFGYERNDHFGNTETVSRDRVATYIDPGTYERNHFYVSGPWLIRAEAAESEGATKIILRFNARVVNIVAGSQSSVPIDVRLDGHSPAADTAGAALQSGQATIQAHDLYELIRLPEAGEHVLEITLPAGVEVFTFTFG